MLAQITKLQLAIDATNIKKKKATKSSTGDDGTVATVKKNKKVRRDDADTDDENNDDDDDDDDDSKTVISFSSAASTPSLSSASISSSSSSSSTSSKVSFFRGTATSQSSEEVTAIERDRRERDSRTLHASQTHRLDPYRTSRIIISKLAIMLIKDNFPAWMTRVLHEVRSSVGEDVLSKPIIGISHRRSVLVLNFLDDDNLRTCSLEDYNIIKGDMAGWVAQRLVSIALYSYLGSCLVESDLDRHMLVPRDNAYEAWQVLYNHHTNTSHSNVQTMVMKFNAMMQKPGEPVKEWGTRVLVAVSALRHIKHEMRVIDVRSRLIGGLRAGYHSLTQSYEGREQNITETIEETIHRLVTCEEGTKAESDKRNTSSYGGYRNNRGGGGGGYNGARAESSNEPGAEQPSASAATFRSGSSSRGSFPHRLCFRCNLTHDFHSIHKPCTNSPQTCSECNGKGHHRDRCFKVHPQLKSEYEKRKQQRLTQGQTQAHYVEVMDADDDQGDEDQVDEEEEDDEVSVEFLGACIGGPILESDRWQPTPEVSVPSVSASSAPSTVPSSTTPNTSASATKEGMRMAVNVNSIFKAYIDTGSSHHAIKKEFAGVVNDGAHSGLSMTMANGQVVYPSKAGDIEVLCFNSNRQYPSFVLKSTVTHHSFCESLISYGKLEEDFNVSMVMKDKVATIRLPDGRILMEGIRSVEHPGLYEVRLGVVQYRREATRPTKPVRSTSTMMTAFMLCATPGRGYIHNTATSPVGSLARTNGEISISQLQRAFQKHDIAQDKFDSEIQTLSEIKHKESGSSSARRVYEMSASHATLCDTIKGRFRRSCFRLELLKRNRGVWPMPPVGSTASFSLSSSSSLSSEERTPFNSAMLHRRHPNAGDTQGQDRCTAYAVSMTSIQYPKQCELVCEHGEHCAPHLNSINGLRVEKLQGGQMGLYTTMDIEGAMIRGSIDDSSSSKGQVHYDVITLICELSGVYWTSPLHPMVDATITNKENTSGQPLMIGANSRYTFTAGVRDNVRYYITCNDAHNNVARYITHSDTPNCVLIKNVDGNNEPHISLCALTKILANTLLTADLSEVTLIEEENLPPVENSSSIDDDGSAIEDSEDDNDGEEEGRSSSSGTEHVFLASQGTVFTRMGERRPTSEPATNKRKRNERLVITVPSSTNQQRPTLSNLLMPPTTRGTTPKSNKKKVSDRAAETIETKEEEERMLQVTRATRANLLPQSKGKNTDSSVAVKGKVCILLTSSSGDALGHEVTRRPTDTRCTGVAQHGMYCDHHTSKIQGVAVKTSGMTNAGMGLWATMDFAIGTTIGIYTGLIRELQSKTTKCGTYWMQLEQSDDDTKSFIDGSTTDCSVMRFVNDGYDDDHNNAKFRQDSDNIELRTTRHINEGDEILASYGNAYWPCPVDMFDRERDGTNAINSSGPAGGANNTRSRHGMDRVTKFIADNPNVNHRQGCNQHSDITRAEGSSSSSDPMDLITPPRSSNRHSRSPAGAVPMSVDEDGDEDEEEEKKEGRKSSLPELIDITSPEGAPSSSSAPMPDAAPSSSSSASYTSPTPTAESILPTPPSSRRRTSPVPMIICMPPTASKKMTPTSTTKTRNAATSSTKATSVGRVTVATAIRVVTAAAIVRAIEK